MSSEEIAISARDLCKVYRLYKRPMDRLIQMARPQAHLGQEFRALQNVSFELRRGEVLGLVGRNGAGKSTLLQIICRTLQPSSGSLQVNGRVAALLELGAGFNPEFSGRENIYLNAAVLGLAQAEIEAKYDEIVEFSGIGEFIRQPVKTYSSGMYVRLAFSIATSVEPDILVVDEALSVGDGEFARKSFDRILNLRDNGASILFCSHSMFQIESICSSAMWLDRGRMVVSGEPKNVVSAYQCYLDEQDRPTIVGTTRLPARPQGFARLTSIRVAGHDVPSSGKAAVLKSLHDALEIDISFASDPALPPPSAAVTLHTADRRIVASAGSWNDCVELVRDSDGQGGVSLSFPRIPLLKGRYGVSVYLFCERGLHQYDIADHVAFIEVTQDGVEQGAVHLPHVWSMSKEGAFAHQMSDPVPDPDAEGSHDLLQELDDAASGATCGATLPAALTARIEGARYGCALARRFGYVYVGERQAWVLRSPPKWKLHWTQLKDRPAWHRLFRDAFGYQMPDALWQWKYGSQNHLGVGAFKGDDMVAFYGATPRDIVFGGKPATALQISDVMVAPTERALMTRSGPFQIVAATFLETSIGYGKKALLGFGFPTERAMRLATKLNLYQEVDRLVEFRWPAMGAKRNLFLSARPLMPAAASAVDRLWLQMKVALPGAIVGVRDWSRIMNRYLLHPVNCYIVLLIRLRALGRVFGVVVLRDLGDEGVEFVDFVAPPERFGALLSFVRRYAAHLGRSSVFCWITAGHANLLDVASPKHQPLPIAIPHNIWSAGPTVEEVRGKWWLMAGDTDFR